MKLAFETRGFCMSANDKGVTIAGKTRGSMFCGDATWAEIYDAYSRATGFIPKKVPPPKRREVEVN